MASPASPAIARQRRRGAAIGRLWTDRRLWTKALFVVGIPIVALAVSLALFVYIDQAQQTTAARLDHTYHVKSDIDRSQALLLSAESGVGGYLLTGDEAQLASYRTAAAELPGTLDALAGLVGDNAVQIPRVAQIRGLLAQRLSLLGALVAAGPLNGGMTAAAAAAQLAQGADLTSQMDDLFAAMTAEEDRLLAIRTAAEAEARSQGTLLLGAVSLLGLGGAVLASLLLATGIVRRIHDLEARARDLVEGRTSPPEAHAADEIGALESTLDGVSALLAAREAELRDARLFLERIIESGPVTALRISLPDGTFSYLSPNAERVLGHPAATILADHGWWAHHVEPADYAELLDRAKRAVETKAAGFEGEWRVLQGDRSWRWIYWVIGFEYGQDGAPTSLLGYALDVSDRHRAQEDRERAREEADRANRAKTEFLSRMSHELRTPLNAILGFGQLLQDDDLPAEPTASVKQINRAGRHLLQLINDILDISRIESGRLALSPEPVSVTQAVNDALDLARPLALARSIALGNVGATCQAYVLADRQRLLQVLLNLLSNGIKYNREGGAIDITCMERDGGRIRISVRDTGPGISAQEAARLFQPFERLGADRSGVEGAGIGLALSKGLMEAMGGAIGVESTPGEGSTFWLELARTEAQLHTDPGLPAEPVSTRSEPAATPVRQRVLHIEDNLANHALVESILARRSDIELVPAMQGGRGLELARARVPDLVLLDLHLPDISGAQVLATLRATPETRDVPVIVLSADASEGQARRLLAAGARAYLTKPLEVAEFRRVVGEALDQAVTHLT